MTMNFSEFLGNLSDPQYQVEGKAPKCPGGHRWDKKLGKCVPDDRKNRGENPGDKSLPDSIEPYNVWGASGMNGDGYALEEGSVSEMWNPLEDEKYQKQLADNDAWNKARKKRMQEGKPKNKKVELRKGEYKYFDKKENRWKSNLEDK